MIFHISIGVDTLDTIPSWIKFKSNISLSFAITASGYMEMWMRNKEWNLTVGEKYPLADTRKNENSSIARLP